MRKPIRLFILCTPLAILFACVAVGPAALDMIQGSFPTHPQRSSPPEPALAVAELVSAEAGSMRVPAEVVQSLGIEVDTVQKASQPRAVTLAGSLALDANHLARVHTRFGGEVVEITSLPYYPPSGSPTGKSVARQVQVGDKVFKGQVLA